MIQIQAVGINTPHDENENRLLDLLLHDSDNFLSENRLAVQL